MARKDSLEEEKTSEQRLRCEQARQAALEGK